VKRKTLDRKAVILNVYQDEYKPDDTVTLISGSPTAEEIMKAMNKRAEELFGDVGGVVITSGMTMAAIRMMAVLLGHKKGHNAPFTFLAFSPHSAQS